MQILDKISFNINRNIPTILQTEATECGLACIAMIVGEFKHEVRQFEKSYDNQQAEQISLMV